jgi:hypothetical protein
MHAKDNPSKCSASTPRAKNNQDKRLRRISHKRVSCVISKMRLNVLNIYHPNDLELQNRSLKTADKADLTILHHLSH